MKKMKLKLMEAPIPLASINLLYLLLGFLSFRVKPVSSWLSGLRQPSPVSTLTYMLGLFSLTIGFYLGRTEYLTFLRRKKFILPLLYFLLSTWTVSNVLFSTDLHVYGAMISLIFIFSLELVYFVPGKKILILSNLSGEEGVQRRSRVFLLATYILSILLFIYPLIEQRSFPLLFIGIKPVTYSPYSSIARFIGVFTYTALLFTFKRVVERIFLISSGLLFFGAYGFRVDLAVFFLIGFFSFFMEEKSLSKRKSIFSAVLILSMAVLALLTLGFLKAQFMYSSLKRGVNPFTLLIFRFGTSQSLYSELIDKSLPFGLEKLRLRIWVSEVHPNIVFGKYLGGVEKGLTAGFFAPFIADGGLIELLLASFLLGFILKVSYLLRDMKGSLISYVVCLSESIAKFEMGFSLYEVAMFAFTLRTTVFYTGFKANRYYFVEADIRGKKSGIECLREA